MSIHALEKRASLTRDLPTTSPEGGYSTGDTTPSVGPVRIALPESDHVAIFTGTEYRCSCHIVGDLFGMSHHFHALAHDPDYLAAKAGIEARAEAQAEANRLADEKARKSRLAAGLAGLTRKWRSA